jgi:hypothetical protein
MTPTALERTHRVAVRPVYPNVPGLRMVCRLPDFVVPNPGGGGGGGGGGIVDTDDGGAGGTL